MPILLEIPAQKATENKTRIAFLVDCAQNGDIKLEATDNLLPRVFFLSIEDLFPWKSFFEKLKIAHDKAGRSQLWADIELFDFEGIVYNSALIPADF